MAKFKKGVSGNPAGRPKGIIDRRQRWQKLIGEHTEELIRRALELAREGDTSALRVLLERAIPPIKAQSEPVYIPGLLTAETLTAKAQAILDAIGNGSLAPDIGESLLAALGNVAKTAEIDDLTRRIEFLEQHKFDETS